MKQFEGFPARMQFTPIPNLFISKILPQIEDIYELKVTLHVFRAVYGKRGYPRYVTLRDLLFDSGLVKSLGGKGEESKKLLTGALDLAVKNTKRGDSVGRSWTRKTDQCCRNRYSSGYIHALRRKCWYAQSFDSRMA